MAVLLLQLFVRQLAAVLAAGATELAASAEALVVAQRNGAELSRVLSSRVASAVNELAIRLQAGPEAASAATEHLARVLAESRKAVPPEPVLPELSLDGQLEALRRRAMTWTVVVALVLFSVQAIRTMVAGPRDSIPYAVFNLGVAGLIATLGSLRPRWRPALNLTLIVAVGLASMGTLWRWYARAPIAPPVLTSWLMACVIAGVTVGPGIALGELALVGAVSLVALRYHPGIPWTAPVNLILGYGLLAWTLWRWPRRLLETLRDRREQAAARIREQRRLVATLFHDLANPLQVLEGEVAELAAGKAEPGALERARAMVRRMRATLAAAASGRVAVQAVEAGRLCDELEELFRERLLRKRLALRVLGPRTVRLRCDEALLRDSVLANLVSNAVKFSPDGKHIDLVISAEPGRVALAVEDRGPGLPAEVLAAVERGGNSPSSLGSAGEPGSGYGLMLAKDYLGAMGGRLELSAREGGGLVARAWLQAAGASDEPPAA